MEALDDFVARARSQNGRHHEAHLGSLNTMAAGVRESYSTMEGQLGQSGERFNTLQGDTITQGANLRESTAFLSGEVRDPLTELRENVEAKPMQNYKPTGLTPRKRKYEYTTDLPQTETHEALVSDVRKSRDFKNLPFSADASSPVGSPTISPRKRSVYNDAEGDEGENAERSPEQRVVSTGLREVSANVVAASLEQPPPDPVPTKLPQADPLVSKRKRRRYHA